MRELTPRQNETEDDFIIRGHRELMNAIPNAMDRNRAVWRAWDMHRGPSPAESLRQKLFPVSKYAVVPGVCYFAEHETRDRDGNILRIGLPELLDIKNHNNRRIMDRESFSAICNNHTTDNAATSKPVLGFAGPYRLGMVGNLHPVFAIFGTESRLLDRAKELESLPRRSVELITVHRTGERYFDPIAAIGADSPRIAMPSQYTATSEGFVLRYSMDAAAFAGGSNTYVPGGAKRMTTEDYSTGQGSYDMNDQMIAEIVQAILDTPQMKWVEQQMQKQHGNADDNLSPLEGSGEKGSGASGAMPGLVAPSENDKNKDEYSINDQHEYLVRRVAALEREKADAQRRSRIEHVSRGNPLVDANEEFKRCLFTFGSTMTDEQFEQHLGMIEKYTQRVRPLLADAIPRGVDPNMIAGDDVSSSKYAAVYEEAVRLHTRDVNKGATPKAYAEYVEDAKKMLGVS